MSLDSNIRVCLGKNSYDIQFNGQDCYYQHSSNGRKRVEETRLRRIIITWEFECDDAAYDHLKYIVDSDRFYTHDRFKYITDTNRIYIKKVEVDID